MTAATGPPILFVKRDGLAFVTLNRPHVLNVYNTEMRDGLWEALTAIHDDDEIQAVIFAGAGRCFCAGADLTQFGSAPSVTIARQVRWERDVWGLIQRFPGLTIAATHSHTLGSGLELSLFCDLRIASDDARFGLPEVALGFLPAAGGSQTLPRVLRRGQALDLVLTGHRIDATQALRIGLVNRIVTREALHADAEALARRILVGGAATVRLAKAAVLRGLELPLAQGLELERHLWRRWSAGLTADGGRRTDGV